MSYARALAKTGARQPAVTGLESCSWLDGLEGVTQSALSITSQELDDFLFRSHYPRHYYRGSRRAQYALWHLTGLKLARLEPSNVALDIGAQSGSWGKAMRRIVGCRILELDLAYRSGRHGDRIGAAVGDIPVPDESVHCMASFCAFNCLQGNADSKLIQDARRLLVGGGRLVIVPLCIGEGFINLYDPQLVDRGQCDPGAQAVEWPGWGNPFGRWYDKVAFAQRILSQLGPDWRTNVVRVHWEGDDRGLQAPFFAAVFEKKIAPTR